MGRGQDLIQCIIWDEIFGGGGGIGISGRRSSINISYYGVGLVRRDRRGNYYIEQILDIGLYPSTIPKYRIVAQYWTMPIVLVSSRSARGHASYDLDDGSCSMILSHESVSCGPIWRFDSIRLSWYLVGDVCMCEPARRGQYSSFDDIFSFLEMIRAGQLQ